MFNVVEILFSGGKRRVAYQKEFGGRGPGGGHKPKKGQHNNIKVTKQTHHTVSSSRFI